MKVGALANELEEYLRVLQRPAEVRCATKHWWGIRAPLLCEHAPGRTGNFCVCVWGRCPRCGMVVLPVSWWRKRDLRALAEDVALWEVA